jgi:hypothetical protein
MLHVLLFGAIVPPSSAEPHLAPQNPSIHPNADLRKLVLGAGREVRSGRRGSTDRVTPCLLPYALLLQREPPLRGELDYQNQVRDHAADESDRPDKLLQQRLTSVNGIRRGFESPVVAGVHLAAQLLKAGMTYQARKARMARTMMTIAVYLIAAYPARPDDSGSGLWV